MFLKGSFQLRKVLLLIKMSSDRTKCKYGCERSGMEEAKEPPTLNIELLLGHCFAFRHFIATLENKGVCLPKPSKRHVCSIKLLVINFCRVIPFMLPCLVMDATFHITPEKSNDLSWFTAGFGVDTAFTCRDNCYFFVFR